jgi:hypothetical protein
MKEGDFVKNVVVGGSLRASSEEENPFACLLRAHTSTFGCKDSKQNPNIKIF